MLDYLTRGGRRKFSLGVIYLGCCAALSAYGIHEAEPLDLGNMAGLAALNTSLATGLGVIVWGNAQEHRAKNGGGE
jgi:hypothetical protein